jgi:hypothetical protein
VDPVSGADAAAISVAGVDEDVQIRPSHLDALSDGYCPAVKAVKSVGIHVMREPARAADAGDEDGLFPRQILVATEPLQCGQDAEITAAGAPARDAALIIVQSQQLVVGLGKETRT